MAMGIPCIITNTELSTPVRPSSPVVKRAIPGRNTILSRLSLKAFDMFVYFLP